MSMNTTWLHCRVAQQKATFLMVLPTRSCVRRLPYSISPRDAVPCLHRSAFSITPASGPSWWRARAGVVFQQSRVEGVQHGGGASRVACSDGTSVPACMVLDATGHARKLVQYDQPFDPGYQVFPPSPGPAHLQPLSHPSCCLILLSCHTRLSVQSG